MSDNETVFLDTVAYKGTRFKEKSILYVKKDTFLQNGNLPVRDRQAGELSVVSYCSELESR